MFTVKIVKANSEERIIEATEVFRDQDRGLIIQQTNDTILISTGGNQYDLNYRPKRSDEPGLDHARVYVMNRYGSTVADYSV